MRIAIRVDAAKHIGVGHVMRCLVLANELKAKGARVDFVCRSFPGHLGESIVADGHRLHLLPAASTPKESIDFSKMPSHASWLGVSWKTDFVQTKSALNKKYFDWVIVDHYSLDNRWERAMRELSSRIMVIDDLADREHDCDLLLDQNLFDDMKTRYNRLIPSECMRLLGPHYSLLRQEFLEIRKTNKKNGGDIRSILIFFGGNDPSNETSKALEAIRLLDNSDIDIDVILGSANSHRKEIEGICSSMLNVRIHFIKKNFYELMAKADLVIGASGSSTWERCCIGLPALVWCIAENQRAIASCADKAGLCLNLGMAEDACVQTVTNALKELFNHKEKLLSMTSRGLDMVDGKGLRRVMAEIIKNLNLTVVSDSSSWINDYIPRLIEKWREVGHSVNWIHKVDEIQSGDCVFLLGCSQILPENIISKNCHNLVVHESALPNGRGWSPLTWKILEGKSKIPISLIEAALNIDSGKIYLTDNLFFSGTELIDELRLAQAEKTIFLCEQFIKAYPEIASCGRRQEGEASYYSRRTIEDSELDLDKTLREQFNLLRTVDNDRYPAFVKIKGEKIIFKIEKEIN